MQLCLQPVVRLAEELPYAAPKIQGPSGNLEQDTSHIFLGADSRGTGKISCCPFSQNDADWHPSCAGNVVTTLLKLQPSTAPTVRAPSLTQAQSAAPVLALLQLPCQVSSQCWLQELLEHLPAWLSAEVCYYQSCIGMSRILADRPVCIPAGPYTQQAAG